MGKTVAISEDVHSLVVKKKEEIFNKYRVTIRISDLTDIVLKNCIGKSEELLGLNKKDETSGQKTQDINMQDSLL